MNTAFSQLAIRMAVAACLASAVVAPAQSLSKMKSQLEGDTVIADAAAADASQRMLKQRYQFRPAGTPQTLAVTEPAAKLQYSVAAGKWADVAEVLASLPADQAGRVYHQIVASLNEDAAAANAKTIVMDGLRPDDVFDLADALPAGIEMPAGEVAATGQLLGKSLAMAGPTAGVVARLEKGDGRFGNRDAAQRTRTAILLLAAGDLDRAAKYLPEEAAVLAADDAATDRLYLCYVLPASIAAENDSDDQRADHLRRVAFKIALRDMLRPDGATPDTVTVVFNLGARTDQSQLVRDAVLPLVKANSPALRPILMLAGALPDPAKGAENLAARQGAIRRQAQLANLIAANLPKDVAADDIRLAALNNYAANWITETNASITRWKSPAQRGLPVPGMRGAMMAPQDAHEISGETLWTNAPSGAWLDAIHGPLKIALERDLIATAMYLNNTDAGMNLLADFAKTYPASDDVAEEALGFWAKQHETARVMPLMNGGGSYMTLGIPLTRSAQDRNIDGLVSMLARIKAIYGRPFPADRVPALFDTVYSQAEVYKAQDLQRVFGPLDQLDTPTLMALSQMMLNNLQAVWVSPVVQQASGTGRSEMETQQQILDGYETLKKLVGDRAKLTQNPSLYAELAHVTFSHADYALDRKLGYAEYNTQRTAGFDALHTAIALSAAGPDADVTPDLYVKWFGMALGSLKLSDVTSKAVFQQDELTKLKTAIAVLPPISAANTREALLGNVGNNLSTLKSDARYRVVQAVLKVAGDDPAARGLQTVNRYYDDLLSEVSFVAAVDGSPKVGCGKPFGIVFSMRHTEKLERESGGFGKYAQNQFQNQQHVTGRPGAVMNYRDELEKHIRSALLPGFDVQSIVWSPADVTSHPTGRDGWRETPLCYVIVKAKDAAIDQIPPVQVDLDFVDHVSEIVLPITTGGVVVDAGRAEPRPVKIGSVELTINDHDAKTGKLELTINATGQGVLPSLEELIDTKSLSQDDITAVKDAGPQPDRLEVPQTTGAPSDNTIAPAMIGHRKWTITLQEKPSAAGRKQFTFPALATAYAQAPVNYRRYADADIVDAAATIDLTSTTEKSSPRWPWVMGGLLAVVLANIAIILRLRRKPKAVAAPAVPRRAVTPFNLLSELRRKSDAGVGLSETQRRELLADIQAIESHYFADHRSERGAADLASIAGRWN